MRTTRSTTPRQPRNITRILVGSVVGVSLLAAGVFGISAASSRTAPPVQSSAARPADTEVRDGPVPAGGNLSAGAKPTQGVPRPLADIEGQTEDIVDKVAISDWTTVSADVAAMRNDWARYSTAAVTDGIPASVVGDFQSALTRLQSAAASRDTVATAQAANDASGAAVEMLAHYDLGHPVQIGRLDVIGRQVVIDAERGDFRAAELQIQQANQQLSSAQQSLAAHGGDQVLTQATATLAEMQRLSATRDATGLKTQAAVLLEVVDGMEQLYG